MWRSSLSISAKLDFDHPSRAGRPLTSSFRRHMFLSATPHREELRNSDWMLLFSPATVTAPGLSTTGFSSLQRFDSVVSALARITPGRARI